MKPFMRLETAPFLLKMTVVGMDPTCRLLERPSSKYTFGLQLLRVTYCLTLDRSSSVSMERKTTSGLLWNFFFTSSYSGCWTRHGPHQVAQKSRIITFPCRDASFSGGPSRLPRVNCNGSLSCVFGSSARRAARRLVHSAEVRS